MKPNSSMKSDRNYLEHILEAINTIEDHTAGLDWDSFSKSKLHIDAVVRELEIVGEASNNLSDKVKKENPELPFRNAVDMRNFLIHEYFGVNVKAVWETCEKDLKPMRDIVKSLLE